MIYTSGLFYISLNTHMTTNINSTDKNRINLRHVVDRNPVLLKWNFLKIERWQRITEMKIAAFSFIEITFLLLQNATGYLRDQCRPRQEAIQIFLKRACSKMHQIFMWPIEWSGALTAVDGLAGDRLRWVILKCSDLAIYAYEWWSNSCQVA